MPGERGRSDGLFSILLFSYVSVLLFPFLGFSNVSKRRRRIIRRSSGKSHGVGVGAPITSHYSPGNPPACVNIPGFTTSILFNEH